MAPPHTPAPEPAARRIAELRSKYQAALATPPAGPVNGYSRALLGTLLTMLDIAETREPMGPTKPDAESA